jgi:hypothetical protein
MNGLEFWDASWRLLRETKEDHVKLQSIYPVFGLKFEPEKNLIRNSNAINRL